MVSSLEAGHQRNRADELRQVLDAVLPLVSSYIENADSSSEMIPQTNGATKNLVKNPSPEDLSRSLDIKLPNDGQEVEGVARFASKILGNSVNTWSQGFMSHLYSSTNAVGVVSELIIAVLNTNVHVYETSPALSITEKAVTKELASLFGLSSPYAGGVAQQGGSAANLTAVVTARNILFPKTKLEGVAREQKSLVLFTSSGGHYSLEKAAQICGLGSAAVWPVAVDRQGRMDVTDLERLIAKARQEGHQPFFVNATAGTTVLGAYDPLPEIAAVCKQERLWFHVDASWGGAVVFSSQLRNKMRGAEAADSITFNPHKMLNVPITCSFLLVSDLRLLWKSNTLPASYLFHGDKGVAQLPDGTMGEDDQTEMWDIADMTLQCGRRGDALKMALSWIYYGSVGYEQRLNQAFSMAGKLANMIAGCEDLVLVSDNPPPCLSVCFYFAPKGRLADVKHTSDVTKKIIRRLRSVNFAIEHAQGDHGLFLRVVVNLETLESTIERLFSEVLRVGEAVFSETTLE